MDQAKDAASSAKVKSTGTGKSVYDSVAANLQSARDASAKQLEDTRSAADQQWTSLQKVCAPSFTIFCCLHAETLPALHLHLQQSRLLTLHRPCCSAGPILLLWYWRLPVNGSPVTEGATYLTH